MTNYYDVIRTAVESAPGPNGRQEVYDRARRAMAGRVRSATPPVPDTVIEAEQAALEDVIERIEAEMRGGRSGESAGDAEAPIAEPEASRTFPRWVLGIAAVAVAGVAAILVTVILRPVEKPAGRSAGSSGIEIDDRKPTRGQNADSRSYVFGRQLIYYRTTHPPGTIVIDKGQRFLYLVRPNVSATRYGIGVGQECFDMPAILRVSRKELAAPKSNDEAEWMGLRLMFLESDARLIHGTNRPDTIGHLVKMGCVRLTNEDVIELYNQTAIGGRVVVTN